MAYFSQSSELLRQKPLNHRGRTRVPKEERFPPVYLREMRFHLAELERSGMCSACVCIRHVFCVCVCVLHVFCVCVFWVRVFCMYTACVFCMHVFCVRVFCLCSACVCVRHVICVCVLRVCLCILSMHLERVLGMCVCARMTRTGTRAPCNPIRVLILIIRIPD